MASQGQIDGWAFVKLIGCPCKPIVLEGLPAVSHHFQTERLEEEMSIKLKPLQGNAFVYYKALMYEIITVL